MPGDKMQRVGSPDLLPHQNAQEWVKAAMSSILEYLQGQKLINPKEDVGGVHELDRAQLELIASTIELLLDHEKDNPQIGNAILSLYQDIISEALPSFKSEKLSDASRRVLASKLRAELIPQDIVEERTRQANYSKFFKQLREPESAVRKLYIEAILTKKQNYSQFLAGLSENLPEGMKITDIPSVSGLLKMLGKLDLPVSTGHQYERSAELYSAIITARHELLMPFQKIELYLEQKGFERMGKNAIEGIYNLTTIDSAEKDRVALLVNSRARSSFSKYPAQVFYSFLEILETEIKTRLAKNPGLWNAIQVQIKTTDGAYSKLSPAVEAIYQSNPSWKYEVPGGNIKSIALTDIYKDERVLKVAVRRLIKNGVIRYPQEP